MINIITINCNGLREPVKIDYLNTVLLKKKVDICLVQETHLDSFRLCNFVQHKVQAKCYRSLTENPRSKGVGIIVKNPNIVVTHFNFD